MSKGKQAKSQHLSSSFLYLGCHQVWPRIKADLYPLRYLDKKIQIREESSLYNGLKKYIIDMLRSLIQEIVKLTAMEKKPCLFILTHNDISLCQALKVYC